MTPQLEHGYTRIANELQDILCKTNFGGYERQVFDAIARKTWGFQKKNDRISNTQLSEMTGLHKNHVSRALKSLIDRGIVTKNGIELGIQKDYRLWTDKKIPKMVSNKKIPKMVSGDTKNGIKKIPKMVSTKEKKETIQNNVIYTRARAQNVFEKNDKEKLEYYGAVLAKELSDEKSLGFYIGACSVFNADKLIRKAKEIVKDGGAKKPAAVFTAWFIEEKKKSIAKKLSIDKQS